MRTALVLSSAVLIFSAFTATSYTGDLVLPGGPPSIRIADKSNGTLTRAEWNTANRVNLAGCMPDVQVVEVTLCIRNCQGKDEVFSVKGDAFTGAMKQMVSNLPPDMPFTVSVKVVGPGKKLLAVPKATFNLRSDRI